MWPFAVATASRKGTVPKFASASVRHLLGPPQTEGASAIHSALETSGSFMYSVRVAHWSVV